MRVSRGANPHPKDLHHLYSSPFVRGTPYIVYFFVIFVWAFVAADFVVFICR